MLKIKNWEKFNLYSPKNPRYQKRMTWFKFYGTDYINNIEIHKLNEITTKAMHEFKTQGICKKKYKLLLRWLVTYEKLFER
jgi:hypothetical protein